jgi:hypothetical protein
MYTSGERLHQSRHFARTELAFLAWNRKQLRTMSKELRRTGLIDVNVSGLVAQYGLIRLCKMRQGQRICGRTRRNGKDRNITTEDAAEYVLARQTSSIGIIRPGVTLIRGNDRIQQFSNSGAIPDTLSL